MSLNVERSKALLKNKKVIAILLAALFLVGMIGLGIKYDLLGSDEGYVIIEFDEEKTLADAKTLCGMGLTFDGIKGGRLTGTEAEHRGAQYILEQFKSAGLSNSHIEEYPVLMFYPESVSVSLAPYLWSGPLGVRVPDPTRSVTKYSHIEDFVIQGYSGSRDWNNFRDDLEIVNIGDGRDESDYEDIGGKAVIVRCGAGSEYGAPANSELFFKAWEHGAEAIILHNLAYGSEHDYLPIFKSSPLPESWPSTKYPDIPFFMVSKDVGDDITRNIGDNKIRIDFDIPVREVNLNVVVGEVPGSTDDLVLLGAHHDTVYNGPGAVDNTAGTVTVIGLARSLASYRPKKTIRLLTFGGEEEGLFGSTFYFNAHRDEITEKTDYMFNFDMSNVDLERGNSLPIQFSDNASVEIAREIADEVLKEERFQKYDVNIKWSSLLSAGSDQRIFARNNISVSSTWGSGSQEYHTYLDTLDHLNPESQALAGKITGSYALYVANH